MIIGLNLFFSLDSFSQIDYGLFYNSSTGNYEVYIYPSQSFSLTTVSTAQVTIVFPTSFPWTPGTMNQWQNDIVVNDVNGGWSANTLVESPCSSPGFDYLSVALDFNSFPLMSLTSGAPLLLFTFSLSGACPGELSLIDNNIDPFDSPDNLCGGTTSPGNSFILTASNPNSFSFTEDYNSNLNIGNTDCNELSELTPLPLEIISFTGRLIDDQKVLLEWKTANEEDVENFIVQHSSDGISYSTIGIKKAKGNNQNGFFSYDLFHLRPVRGINYYRLKTMDIDGSTMLSKIVEITIKNNLDGLVMFPNPTTGIVTLQLPAFIGFTDQADLQIQLYDGLHHLVKEFDISAVNNQMIDVDLSGLIPAAYTIRIRHGSNIFNELLIIEGSY